MQPIQIIAIIFVIFAYSRAILQFRGKKISLKEFFFWSLVWIAAIIFFLVPGFFSIFSEFFGIKRPVDLIIYVSIIVLFYLIFRMYVKIESMEQDITKVVRNSAINSKRKK